MNYPYDSLWINGKVVTLESIIHGTALPNSNFETSTFSFLQDWFSDVQEFTLKTSGSTGPPKEIIVSRNQMIASATLTVHALNLQPGMTSLICLNTNFIAGKMMLVRCLISGMKMIMTEPAANPFNNIPDAARIDFTALVPYQVGEVLQSPQASLFNNLKTVIIGGAKLPDTHRKTLKKYSCTCYATYGMTETLSHVALQNLKTDDDLFHALPGITLSKDQRNCLIIQADHFPEPISTNDIVEIHDPQTFTWLGRWDNVINSGGFKIHSEKIEAQIEKELIRFGITNRFFVAGLPDEKWGQKVVLLIEGKLTDNLIHSLKNRLETTLLTFEIPKLIRCIHQFKETKTGKIDRLSTLKLL